MIDLVNLLERFLATFNALVLLAFVCLVLFTPVVE